MTPAASYPAPQVTTETLGAAKGLQIQTFINGQLRQNDSTTDMIFGA